MPTEIAWIVGEPIAKLALIDQSDVSVTHYVFSRLTFVAVLERRIT